VTTHKPDPEHGLSNGLHIHVPHGSGFGNSSQSGLDYLLSLYQASDIYCGISPYEHFLIKQTLGSKANPSVSFIATGCPKNDMFASYITASGVERARLRHKLKQLMNIPGDQPVIFIASHWTPSGLLRKFGTSLIQALSALDHKFLIIQGSHPNLWNWHVNSQTSRWISQALSNEEERGVVSLNRGVSDAIPLLASDIVIADHSSIAIEAALLEKRLYLCVDPKNFNCKLVHQIYKGVGIQFSGADELAEAISTRVEFPDLRSDMIVKIKQLFGYKIGNASKKVASVILNAARGGATRRNEA